jgi:hypothetical protein
MPRFTADVTLDEAAIEAFLTSPAGPVGEYLAGLGRRVHAVARSLAPVGARDSKFGHKAGYLRSQIGWETGRDSAGLFVDVFSNAKSSAANPFTPGGPYAVWNELPGTAPHHAHLPAWIVDNEHPYLRPALESVIGSL